MKISKLMKKLETSHIVMIVAALALGYAVYNYSRNKSIVTDNMSNGEAAPSNTHSSMANASQLQGQASQENAGNPQPSAPINQISGPETVTGVTTSSPGTTVGTQNQVVDPSELLPKDNNSEFSKLNPTSSDLNINLLTAGEHQGINTVGTSLRNANLQLRSEPANPQQNVGPWNNTTIQPDMDRRPLEIGCGSN